MFREPASSLRLAYGRADLEPPRYDLALLAPQVLGEAAAEAAPGPEPLAGAPSATDLVSARMFWVILAAAVAVLLGMIVRLVRREERTAERSG